MFVRPNLFAPVAIALALSLAPSAVHAQNVKQTNLVSDIPGLAAHTDPNLVNPWGVSFSPASPFWVSDAGTGKSTLYTTNGTPIPLVVTTQGPATGQAFTGGQIAGDSFIFATANGNITGWRGALGTTAEVLYAGPAGSSYLGLAFGKNASGSRAYAANFGWGRIDVFNSAGALATPSGSFVDPNLPAGYAPFNVQNVGGILYVTYAVRGANGHDVAGAGNGVIDKYDLDGNLLGRLASGGALNSPWGVAIAPSSFGTLGGSLLVGNFGDGTIHAYDPISGNLISELHNSSGAPLVIDGLWSLNFGNGGNGGKTDILYFTAGIDGERHGLMGGLSPVPEPAVTGTAAGLALMGLCAVRRLRKKATAAKVAVIQ